LPAEEAYLIDRAPIKEDEIADLKKSMSMNRVYSFRLTAFLDPSRKACNGPQLVGFITFISFVLIIKLYKALHKPSFICLSTHNDFGAKSISAMSKYRIYC
jgi:hypothetical protein